MEPKAKILVADDEADIVYILSRALRVEAYNAREARCNINRHNNARAKYIPKPLELKKVVKVVKNLTTKPS